MSRSEDDLEEDIQLIKKFISDKVEKNNTEGVVLGLSGGLDSTTVLKLSVDALGKENVHGIIMPESATPEEDMRDARWIAEKWDVEYDEFDIDPIMECFPADPKERLAYANLKARIRSCIEYYTANVENKLVVGTSNKSELLLGYTTKYGDSAVDFLPIGDVYKSDVRRLAEKIDVPERFLDKVPRAGLWEGQTDEEELGHSYEEIDKVLKSIENQDSLEKIAEKNGLSEGTVKDVKDMIHSSVHKRKFPTVLKLRSRTVGVDWREFSM
uniref:NAD+ synthetase n=1 Tax=uncultured organism TaxID=155900 RepID=M1PPI8_9ZZZZ|nr:NAD+ synthetase [uncultured organism]